MRRTLGPVAAALVLAGCSNSPAPAAAPDAVAASVPKAPVTVSPEEAFWSHLVAASGGITEDVHEELVTEGGHVCEVLGREDLLMDGSVSYWAGWSEKDPEAAELFWSVAVEELCPEMVDEWEAVQEIKATLNP